jgi:TonB family protein
MLIHTTAGLCEQPKEPDTYPAPVGGMTAIMQAVEYPASAKKDGIEGKVLVEVVVDVHGKTKSANVKSGVRQDLDEAALGAVQKVEWTPALKNNQPVETTVVVPILFKLDTEKKK